MLDITIFIVTSNIVMNDLVAFAQTLGDPTRWRIVRLLSEHALCVCELADILGMPQSTVSSHVQIIRRTGMLESERCEKWIYHRISRTHRSLIQTLEKFFSASPAEDATLRKDAQQALRRMARRESTCCPGPKQLGGPARRDALEELAACPGKRS